MHSFAFRSASILSSKSKALVIMILVPFIYLFISSTRHVKGTSNQYTVDFVYAATDGAGTHFSGPI
jgi:hypothetical protein